MSYRDKSGHSIAFGRTDDGRAMDFGLYHSRGSVPGELPWTRYEEDKLAVCFARLKRQYFSAGGDDLKWLNPGSRLSRDNTPGHAISPGAAKFAMHVVPAGAIPCVFSP